MVWYVSRGSYLLERRMVCLERCCTTSRGVGGKIRLSRKKSNWTNISRGTQNHTMFNISRGSETKLYQHLSRNQTIPPPTSLEELNHTILKVHHSTGCRENSLYISRGTKPYHPYVSRGTKPYHPKGAPLNRVSRKFTVHLSRNKAIPPQRLSRN